MNRLAPKHARAIRWMHWINAPSLAVMIWSGLQIYWANDVYALRVGGVTLFHFFPDWFYRTLGLEYRLAVGMAFHFTFMWLFAIKRVALRPIHLPFRRVALLAAEPAYAT